MQGDITQRLGQARLRTDEILRLQQPDVVCIESVIYINSKQIVIKLAKFFGQVEAAAAVLDIPVLEVTPLKWQYAIGNDSFSKPKRARLRRQHPGKSKTWLKAEERRQRKQYTIDHFERKYGAKFTTDNQSDAVGVAAYAYYNLTRRK